MSRMRFWKEAISSYKPWGVGLGRAATSPKKKPNDGWFICDYLEWLIYWNKCLAFWMIFHNFFLSFDMFELFWSKNSLNMAGSSSKLAISTLLSACWSLTLISSRCPSFPHKKRQNQTTKLVGALNPSEKYESQLGWLFPIYGKIKHVPNHQPEKYQRDHHCNGKVSRELAMGSTWSSVGSQVDIGEFQARFGPQVWTIAILLSGVDLKTLQEIRALELQGRHWSGIPD